MACKECIKRDKDWEGGDPTCAFEDNTFSPDNWRCATMSELRSIAKSKRRDCFYYRDDMANESIGVISLPETDIEELRGYLILTWYKDRGRTGSAKIICNDEIHRDLTYVEADEILYYFKYNEDAL